MFAFLSHATCQPIIADCRQTVCVNTTAGYWQAISWSPVVQFCFHFFKVDSLPGSLINRTRSSTPDRKKRSRSKVFRSFGNFVQKVARQLQAAASAGTSVSRSRTPTRQAYGIRIVLVQISTSYRITSIIVMN